MATTLRSFGYLLTIIIVGLFFVAKINYYPEAPRSAFLAAYTYPDSQFVQINGMRVHYVIRGEGENLVLLHGQGGNIHHFDAMFPELIAGYRVISLDYIGHGLTGPDPNLDYSNGNFIEFFESFFNALNLEKMHLVGNSMGGYWAMLYAAKHPHRVQSLSLLNSFGGEAAKTFDHCQNVEPSNTAFNPEDLPFADHMSRWFLPRFMVKSALKPMFFQPHHPTDAFVSLHRDLFSVAGNRLYRKHFNPFDRPMTAIDAAQLDRPALVLWGREDQLLRLCEGLNLHDKLANSELVVLDRTGHLPMVESPMQTSRLILNFVKQHSSETDHLGDH